jgi:hypothetical protein
LLLESLLDLRCDDSSRQRSPIWCHRGVVLLASLLSLAFLAHELHHWQPRIDVELQEFVDPIELIACRLALIAVIPDELPHHAPVLLFDLSLIALREGLNDTA